MSTESFATEKKPRRRLLMVLLIASLGVNAALGGFFAVQTWRRFDMAGPNEARGFLRFVRWKLPKPDRTILDRAAEKRDNDMIDAQAEFRKAMNNAFAQLRRPDFNEADFRTAVAVAREKRLHLADVGLDVLLDTVGHISPEGRTALIPKMRSWDRRN